MLHCVVSEPSSEPLNMCVSIDDYFILFGHQWWESVCIQFFILFILRLFHILFWFCLSLRERWELRAFWWHGCSLWWHKRLSGANVAANFIHPFIHDWFGFNILRFGFAPDSPGVTMFWITDGWFVCWSRCCDCPIKSQLFCSCQCQLHNTVSVERIFIV